jgi:hypothetical protein
MSQIKEKMPVRVSEASRRVSSASVQKCFEEIIGICFDEENKRLLEERREHSSHRFDGEESSNGDLPKFPKKFRKEEIWKGIFHRTQKRNKASPQVRLTLKTLVTSLFFALQHRSLFSNKCLLQATQGSQWRKLHHANELKKPVKPS